LAGGVWSSAKNFIATLALLGLGALAMLKRRKA